MFPSQGSNPTQWKYVSGVCILFLQFSECFDPSLSRHWLVKRGGRFGVKCTSSHRSSLRFYLSLVIVQKLYFLFLEVFKLLGHTCYFHYLVNIHGINRSILQVTSQKRSTSRKLVCRKTEKLRNQLRSNLRNVALQVMLRRDCSEQNYPTIFT